MQSFLLIISFLLHIIVLVAVYYLFQQIQLLKQDNTKELTDLFETYLKEIRSENRRLESKIEFSTFSNERKEKINELKDLTEKYDLTFNENEAPKLNTDTIHDQFETSLDAKILQLHHQGMEVSEIAQMLNCGKTEAELLINLYDKKKQKS